MGRHHRGRKGEAGTVFCFLLDDLLDRLDRLLLRAWDRGLEEVLAAVAAAETSPLSSMTASSNIASNMPQLASARGWWGASAGSEYTGSREQGVQGRKVTSPSNVWD